MRQRTALPADTQSALFYNLYNKRKGKKELRFGLVFVSLSFSGFAAGPSWPFTATRRRNKKKRGTQTTKTTRQVVWWCAKKKRFFYCVRDRMSLFFFPKVRPTSSLFSSFVISFCFFSLWVFTCGPCLGVGVSGRDGAEKESADAKAADARRGGGRRARAPQCVATRCL